MANHIGKLTLTGCFLKNNEQELPELWQLLLALETTNLIDGATSQFPSIIVRIQCAFDNLCIMDIFYTLCFFDSNAE